MTKNNAVSSFTLRHYATVPFKGYGSDDYTVEDYPARGLIKELTTEEGFETEAEVKEVLEDFFSLGTPPGVLVIDLYAGDGLRLAAFRVKDEYAGDKLSPAWFERVNGKVLAHKATSASGFDAWAINSAVSSHFWDGARTAANEALAELQETRRRDATGEAV